jgi:hypothetical protein
MRIEPVEKTLKVYYKGEGILLSDLFNKDDKKNQNQK